MDDLETIGIEEIAKILRKAPETVRVDVTRKPETLPPRLNIPGSKRVLWLRSDVNDWLRSMSTAGGGR
jgi:predicted DNA-binding transcriptional regulator AlpA